MMHKVVVSLLLSFFLCSTSVSDARSRKKKTVGKKKVDIEQKKLDEEKKENKEEGEVKTEEAVTQNEVDDETRQVMEQNEKYQQQRAVKTDIKEDDGKSEEEKKQELIEINKINRERENKEIQADKFLSQGVSDDELVGEEFVKWSTIKAKMTSKEFKRMYLENLKMKRVLQRYYATQKGNKPSTAQKDEDKKVDSIPVNTLKKQDEESFYIYGNYEDEAGELSGDRYVKWSALKSKTSALQFRSLVKRNKFLQTKVKKLINENNTLKNENEALRIKNRRLLRG